jgi:sugar lactone lactonase YvrE
MGCGDNGGGPDGPSNDGPGGDSSVDAPVDAPSIDAPMIDAIPPDAAPCDIPPFTNGISTLAGCSTPAVVDGTRDYARFANPTNVAVASDGHIYVADFDNNLVRKVTTAGTVSTLVSLSTFHRPFGMAFAPTGEFYVQTDDNAAGMHSPTTGTIWRVNLTTGVPTPLLQNIGRPRGLLVLSDGRLVLSDMNHHTISLWDPTGAAQPTLLAGAVDTPAFMDNTTSGATVRFNTPYGVADLHDGRIAVADYGNNRIRAVTLATGATSTLAGTGTPGNGNGAALTATFNAPQDLAIDGNGTIYITDTNNHVIRRLMSGTVDTIIGNGTAGYLDSDVLLNGEIYASEGLDFSAFDGKLYVADGNHGDGSPHHRIRVVILP